MVVTTGFGRRPTARTLRMSGRMSIPKPPPPPSSIEYLFHKGSGEAWCRGRVLRRARWKGWWCVAFEAVTIAGHDFPAETTCVHMIPSNKGQAWRPATAPGDFSCARMSVCRQRMHVVCVGAETPASREPTSPASPRAPASPESSSPASPPAAASTPSSPGEILCRCLCLLKTEFQRGLFEYQIFAKHLIKVARLVQISWI